jgi:hypothetical protein
LSVTNRRSALRIWVRQTWHKAEISLPPGSRKYSVADESDSSTDCIHDSIHFMDSTGKGVLGFSANELGVATCDIEFINSV